ncbi:glutathione S-transferase T3-like [Salvia splendens]|uniref:glutathione S-transferase T3-like n=1 Tax=Salvia splendens TaxID=180675 RepID=UPI001C260A9D|nr:glutathione S-transferase T3-like [Salvia splendens]
MLGLLSTGIPDTPVARVETPVLTRGGGGSRGSGGGRGRGPRGGGGSRGTGNVGGHSGSSPGIASSEGSGPGGSGDQPEGSSRGKPYSKDESIAVAKAWDAITSDPVVGTDHESGSFWRRVMMAYEELKPDGAEKRDPEQIRKKFGRILRATKLFASIYENNLHHAESGRSAEDVKTLSEGQYRKTGQPKFTLWEELY